MVYGEQDSLITLRHSERLKALAPHAQLLRVAGAAHNDVQDFPVYPDGFSGALAAL